MLAKNIVLEKFIFMVLTHSRYRESTLQFGPSSSKILQEKHMSHPTFPFLTEILVEAVLKINSLVIIEMLHLFGNIYEIDCLEIAGE